MISLAKIGIRDKINQIRLARSMVKHSDSVATTSSETELIEDLPPSYLSTIATQTLSGQDVDETATKETIIEYNDIVTTQPRTNSSDSVELSTRSSLQSTKLSMDTRLLSRTTRSPMRPVPAAWNENIVLRNIYQRDQMSLLCFCTSALGTIVGLAFYCTSI